MFQVFKLSHATWIPEDTLMDAASLWWIYVFLTNIFIQIDLQMWNTIINNKLKQ